MANKQKTTDNQKEIPNAIPHQSSTKEEGPKEEGSEAGGGGDNQGQGEGQGQESSPVRKEDGPQITTTDLAVQREKEILGLVPTMTEAQLNIAAKDQHLSQSAKDVVKDRIRELIRVDQKAEAEKSATASAAPAQPRVPDPKAEQTPRAIPATSLESQETAMCQKTTTKFIAGSWRYLVKGKTITAPKAVIEALRPGGFVK